jgi:tRNA 2-thiouridine synthesizing protein E
MLVVDGLSIPTDKEGYLKNLEDWSDVIADAIAQQNQITLTEQHWEIIWLLRDFYREFEISPAMRVLVKTVGQRLGKDKGRSIYLMRLFPESPAKFASKIAGLPKPTNCL